MFRTLIAILLVLIGIVGIAGGVWGIYTVQSNENLALALASDRVATLISKTQGSEAQTNGDASSQVENAPSRIESEDSNIFVDAVNGILNAAGDVANKVDEFTINTFGKSATGMANAIVEEMGLDIDLTNETDVKLNVCRYRVTILLAGIIAVQFGLLMIKYRR